MSHTASTEFADAFAAKLAAIKSRAEAAGSNITQVCKRSGVARATYERWMQRAPQTVAKVDELMDEVVRIEAEAAARQPS